MDDAELLTRCIAGDGDAWDRLVRTHAGLLHGMVGRVLRRGQGPQPDIEDVVQAVFLKLWEDGRRRLRTFKGGCRLSTWLVAVARREALDRLRGRSRQEHHEAAYEAEVRERPAAPAGPVERAASREQLEQLAAALAALPPRDRLLVTLIEEGWTYRRAARVLGLRENSIGPLLQRARTRLGRELEVYGSPGSQPPTGRLERP